MKEEKVAAPSASSGKAVKTPTYQEYMEMEFPKPNNAGKAQAPALKVTAPTNVPNLPISASAPSAGVSYAQVCFDLLQKKKAMNGKR